MSYENASNEWARQKVIERTSHYWGSTEPCNNPEIISVHFEDGAGEYQIGDMTWDYDEDSVTISYLDDNGESKRLYFEMKFSEILEELIG